MNYQIKANAFACTFAFLPTQKPTQKSKVPASKSTVMKNDAAKIKEK